MTSSPSHWNFAAEKRARIVVVENAAPDDPQDFSFTAGGGLSPASFILDDDNDPVRQNTQVFDHVTPGSGYSITQNLPTGWYKGSATCDNGSNPSSITLAANQTVTCTYVNSR